MAVAGLLVVGYVALKVVDVCGFVVVAVCDCRFIRGDDVERSNMLKLIPHLAEGSWLLKQVQYAC